MYSGNSQILRIIGYSEERKSTNKKNLTLPRVYLTGLTPTDSSCTALQRIRVNLRGRRRQAFS